MTIYKDGFFDQIYVNKNYFTQKHTARIWAADWVILDNILDCFPRFSVCFQIVLALFLT